jgi:hypothetical protein
MVEDNKAWITIRATGSFFKGPHININHKKLNQSMRNGGANTLSKASTPRRLSDEPLSSLRQRLSAWVFGANKSLESLHSARKLQNPDGACDYGEFPLSFAASIGSTNICELLVERCTDMSAWEEYEFREQQKRLVMALDKMDKPCTCMKDEYDTKHDKHKVLFHSKFYTHAQPDQVLPKTRGVHHADELRYLFVNAQDSDGNTALHMAVNHDQIEVVDWLLDHGGASLRLLNADGLTPFTLAAKLGNVRMFYHLLESKHMCETAWVYGHVRMTQMSLEQVDSFKVEGNDLHKMPNWRSAIEIIVEHEVVVFSKDELFNKLIQDKWNKFARKKYLKHVLFPYLFFLAIFTAAITLRCFETRRRWNLASSGAVQVDFDASVPEWLEALNNWSGELKDKNESLAMFILHMLTGFVGVPWLLYRGFRQARLKRRDRDPEEDGNWNYVSFIFKNMTFILNLLSSCALILTLIGRFVGNEDLELDSWAVACVLVWVNFLTIIVPFKFFGAIVITMYRMLVADLFKFFVVYVISTLAFSISIWVLYQRAPDPGKLKGTDDFPGAINLLNYFWVSLGDKLDQMDLFEASRDAPLMLAFHLMYIIVATLLLLNLLIAMMGQTFQDNAEDTHRTWVFPFASLVLDYERKLGPKEKRDLTHRFRSGKYAGENKGKEKSILPGSVGGQMREASGQDDDDKHMHWKSVFYEINIGINKADVQQADRNMVYEKEHRAILEEIDQKMRDSRDRMVKMMREKLQRVLPPQPQPQTGTPAASSLLAKRSQPTAAASGPHSSLKPSPSTQVLSPGQIHGKYYGSDVSARRELRLPSNSTTTSDQLPATPSVKRMDLLAALPPSRRKSRSRSGSNRPHSDKTLVPSEVSSADASGDSNSRSRHGARLPPRSSSPRQRESRATIAVSERSGDDDGSLRAHARRGSKANAAGTVGKASARNHTPLKGGDVAAELHPDAATRDGRTLHDGLRQGDMYAGPHALAASPMQSDKRGENTVQADMQSDTPIKDPLTVPVPPVGVRTGRLQPLPRTHTYTGVHDRDKHSQSSNALWAPHSGRGNFLLGNRRYSEGSTDKRARTSLVPFSPSSEQGNGSRHSRASLVASSPASDQVGARRFRANTLANGWDGPTAVAVAPGVARERVLYPDDLQVGSSDSQLGDDGDEILQRQGA